MRNSVMHTSTMTVTTAELSTYMTTMIDLLQDSRYLLNDPVAQQAALEIRQVKLTVSPMLTVADVLHAQQGLQRMLTLYVNCS